MKNWGVSSTTGTFVINSCTTNPTIASIAVRPCVSSCSIMRPRAMSTSALRVSTLVSFASSGVGSSPPTAAASFSVRSKTADCSSNDSVAAASSVGYRPKGSKPRSPGARNEPTRAASLRRSDAAFSTIAPAAATASQYAIVTLPRPPLSTEGARPMPAASGFTRSDGSPRRSERRPSKSSETGQPTAASMASRPCFSSASRYA
mmetsp:Transcript_633/g.1886  ORF Transcript_633/g.1886 Transcript_633/m.1886 type:complete len:204 (-) Transcript_633:486-1097(-)